DAPSNLHRRGSVIDVEFTDANSTRGASIGDSLMHAIQTTHESGLAAAGGADNGGCVVGWRLHGDVVEGLGFAEPGIQLFDFDPDSHGSACSLEHSAAGNDADRTNRNYDKHNQDQRSRPGLAMPFIEGRY